MKPKKRRAGRPVGSGKPIVYPMQICVNLTEEQYKLIADAVALQSKTIGCQIRRGDFLRAAIISAAMVVVDA